MIELLEKYLEPHRSYHSIEHIINMIRNLSLFSLTENEVIKLKYAIYYHDYVYEPGSPTNEQDSVDVFLNDVMNNKIDIGDSMKLSELAAAVMLMIQDTATHVPSTYLSKYLIDLDLWSLADTDEYNSNCKKLRWEYSAFSDEEFYPGRIKWLESRLRREQIYYTNYCLNGNFHDKAVKNLTDDLYYLTRDIHYNYE